MTQSTDSLARLTLRQLRHKASDLGVPLYSRKTKAALIQAINSFQKKAEIIKASKTPFWRAPEKESSESVDNANNQTRVVFLPRDPQWAFVFWEISESDRKKAFSKGASRLCLRLSDVTGIGDGTAHKQTMQEVIVDSHSTEWYLSIPLSDRDYRVELGYRLGTKWSSLAFSDVARVPSLYPSDQIFDQFVPFSLESPTSQVVSSDIALTADPSDSGLHERLYQTATKTFYKTRTGSEEFQERRSGEPKSHNDSGIGLWASGRNQSGVGGVVPPKQKSFWLVADSELVIYGSTDPSATLTIAGEEVPLSSDGTFRLQVPFRDGQQKYPIEAKDSNSDQTRNITMQFERITPQDNTTPNIHSQNEWF